tara:strand:+ start:1045 stop:1383 length:339 start_codon:yes stop_codon:yes gene_type:complete
MAFKSVFKNIKLVVFDKDGTLINQNKFFCPMIKNYLEFIKPYVLTNVDIYQKVGFDPIKQRMRSDSIFSVKNDIEIREEINKLLVKHTEQINQELSNVLESNNDTSDRLPVL